MPIAIRPAALVLPFFHIALSSAASFDCDEASTPTERTICASGQLSALDDQMVQSYRDALASAGDRNALTLSQRLWLREKRNTCQDDTVCLRQAYLDRIAELASPNLPRTVQAPSDRNRTAIGPSRGKCEDGRIFEILFLFDPQTPAAYSGAPAVPSKAQFRWLGTNYIEVLQDMHGNKPWYANERISWSQSHDDFYLKESSNGQTKNLICHPVQND